MDEKFIAKNKEDALRQARIHNRYFPDKQVALSSMKFVGTVKRYRHGELITKREYTARLRK